MNIKILEHKMNDQIISSIKHKIN